jgi:DNA-binding transcriptional MocR family regulator
LHRNLLTALGTGIASGKYPAGRVLTLEGVSAEHGVSRSVAREAIRVLESMGMVAARRRVGITIQPSDKWNVFDPRVIRWRLESSDRAALLVTLSELRRGFEPAAAPAQGGGLSPNPAIRALSVRQAQFAGLPLQANAVAALVLDKADASAAKRVLQPFQGLATARRNVSAALYAQDRGDANVSLNRQCLGRPSEHCPGAPNHFSRDHIPLHPPCDGE